MWGDFLTHGAWWGMGLLAAAFWLLLLGGFAALVTRVARRQRLHAAESSAESDPYMTRMDGRAPQPSDREGYAQGR